LHTDLWDVHVTKGTSGSNPTLWIAGDGGVYRTTLPSSFDPKDKKSLVFSQYNQGLHTHHIHTLSLVQNESNRGPKLLYSTSDNDSWFINPAAGSLATTPWTHLSNLGDTNLTVADSGGSGIAISYGRPSAAELTKFGESDAICSLPANVHHPLCVYGQPFPLQPNLGFNSDEYFNVVQSRRFETGSPYLDVVMLSLRAGNRNDPRSKHQVLLRAPEFAKSPDANVTSLAGPAWIDVGGTLPDGTERVWTTGGHNNTIYYFFAKSGSAAKLWKHDPKSGWTDLTSLLSTALFDSYQGVFGPAFVDPYVPGRMYVLTSSGVEVARFDGDKFQTDAVLTSLITASKTYPIVTGFGGARPGGTLYRGFPGTHARSFGTLGQIAFDLSNPNFLVAAAPYTGVFLWDSRVWRDLTPFLPEPTSEVSSVAIDADAVYVGLEGGGIWRIRSYDQAPIASYFVRDSLPAGQLARLVASDGSHAGGRQVRVVVTLRDGTPQFDAYEATDASGGLTVPSSLQGTPPGISSISPLAAQRDLALLL
jgi:hypothetical protein